LAYHVYAGLSGEYVARLKRRALSFLRAVDNVDDADLAAFFAEQAMQLYIKAVVYEIFGERVRGYELRTLLGMLSSYLKKHGYENVATEVNHFVDEHRRDLITAEEAYIGGRYGELSYLEGDSKRLRDVVRRLSSWVRIRFERLRRWREYAESVARAAKDILGEGSRSMWLAGLPRRGLPSLVK